MDIQVDTDKILVIRINLLLRDEQLRVVSENIKKQIEYGYVTLPPYMDAQLVPKDVSVELVDINGDKI